MYTVKQSLFSLLILPLFFACSKADNEAEKSLLPLPPEGRSYSDPMSAILINAVKATGAKSINGKLVSKICEIAKPHLDYMISENNISHDGYDKRSSLLNRYGSSGSGEIVAYNCSTSVTPEKGAEACAKGWVNSPGHWDLMQKYWDGFCYAMKKTGNCYYCIGLFSNGKW